MATKSTATGETKEKQRRVYFCRPCGRKHPSPTNGKCTLKNAAQGQAEQVEGADELAKGRRRERQPKQAEKPRTPRAKRKRDASPVGDRDEQSSGDENDPFEAILQKLESIAQEGRTARQQLAEDSRRERDEIRRSISSLSKYSSEPDSSKKGETPDVETQAQAQGGQQDDRRGGHVTPETLSRARDPIQTLRNDARSATMANKLLSDDESGSDVPQGKKIKSGYLQTINDNASVQAQWPQLNVFRASQAPATYDSLTIDEFCSSFTMYIEDALRCPEPNVAVALDYSTYLRDLMDEVPMTTWEGVKAAHGELLRQIEQGRVKWYDVNERSRILAKALRKEVLALTLKPQAGRKSIVTNAQTGNQNAQLDRKPCEPYQTAACHRQATHTNDGCIWLHCCATCYKIKNHKFSHPRSECNRQKALDAKDKPTKNE